MVSISPIKMELMVVTYGKNAINKDYTKLMLKWMFKLGNH